MYIKEQLEMKYANVIMPDISNKAYLDLLNHVDLPKKLAKSHQNLEERNSW